MILIEISKGLYKNSGELPLRFGEDWKTLVFPVLPESEYPEKDDESVLYFERGKTKKFFFVGKNEVLTVLEFRKKLDLLKLIAKTSFDYFGFPDTHCDLIVDEEFLNEFAKLEFGLKIDLDLSTLIELFEVNEFKLQKFGDNKFKIIKKSL